MDITEMKLKIGKLEKKREELDHDIRTLRAEMVEGCKHARVAEYKREKAAPWTICLDCGYAEEQWGIGTWKLPRTDFSVSKILETDFYKTRTIFRTQEQIVHEKIHVGSHGGPMDVRECAECRESGAG